MIDWKARAQTLAEQLRSCGALAAPAWQAAFAAVPRHVFVPRFYALDQFNQPRTLVDGNDPTSRDTWLDAVYRDDVLVTHYRVIGTMEDGQDIRVAASSASMPQVVGQMLEALDVHDGQRVLEIGTGTGYNAALLSARLGPDQVTSVEVDPTTAAEAATHLDSAGYRPTLVVGDGAAGHPDRAPYERSIATCAVDHIPTAWIDQLADEGLLLAPLTFAGGPLAALHKTAPGEVEGRLSAEQTYFMSLRHAGAAGDRGAPTIPDEADLSYLTTTGVELKAWADPEFRIWLALHQPEAVVADRIDEQGDRTGVAIYTAAGRATVDYSSGEHGSWPVAQDQARMWNTVEAAWQAWLRHDQPARTRIGITARLDGDQWAWLDRPDGAVRWPLSTH